MCGIVAVFDRTMGVPSKDLFRTLLYAGVVRGSHSTGVAAIATNGTVEVYKRAVPSFDFLEMAPADKCIEYASKGLIGHNRYATMGARTTKNAHPFQQGHITLVHNGTLTNKHRLTNASQFDTDSEAIAYNLSITSDPKEVLELLEGAYALIWHDALMNTVSIAKNEERSLHCFQLTKTAKGDVTYALCSEEAMGDWIIGRERLFTIDQSIEIQSGVITTLDLTSWEVTGEEFSPAKKHRGTGGGWQGITREVVRLVVDSVDDKCVYASTLDGLFETKLYKSVHPQVQYSRMDDIIEGQLASTSGEVAYMVAGTLRRVFKTKEVPTVKKEKPDYDFCQICGNKITDEDWRNGDWDMLTADGGAVHGQCADELAAAEAQTPLDSSGAQTN